tara:strand:+ start:538 stop:1209 length:672 start_codon:yes stop_codon:yes gene_type:complete
MALILSIDTASKNCSVSLAKDGILINTIEEIRDSFLHGQKLHVFCEKIILESNIKFSDIDAYALSIGPGSYTGLRIGSAAVKGFGFIFKKPIITIPTLKSMAYSQKFNQKLLCPILDSRQGEVYAAVFDQNLNCLKPAHPHIISSNSFASFLNAQEMIFFGTGVSKIQEYISHKNAEFLDNLFPSSKYLVEIAESMYYKDKFADLASFKPLYLKDFIPTKSKS